MAKSRCTFRIYKQHDMDLLTVCGLYPNIFSKLVKQALKAYAHEESFSIDIIEPLPEPKGTVTKHLIIDTVKDADIYTLLSNIKPRQRCSFIKAIIRSCLVRFPLEQYLAPEYLNRQGAALTVHGLESPKQSGGVRKEPKRSINIKRDSKNSGRAIVSEGSDAKQLITENESKQIESHGTDESSDIVEMLSMLAGLSR